MMADARAGRFDLLVVWSLDRFAARARQAILTLAELHELGIEFLSCQEGLRYELGGRQGNRPLGGSAGPPERTALRESSAEGLHQAVRSGTRSGRPIGRPRRAFNPDRVGHLRAQGWSLRRIAERLGIGLGTVVRAVPGMQ